MIFLRSKKGPGIASGLFFGLYFRFPLVQFWHAVGKGIALKEIIPPRYERDISKKVIKQFETFLTERGSEIRASTNPYEFWRFLDHTGHVCSVHVNAIGRLTWSEGARIAWCAFKGGTTWRSLPKARRKVTNRERTFKSLVERDGDRCIFCNRPVSYEDYSCEHLLPVTHGGPSRMANYAISHKHCNAAAGSMSLVEKIRHSASVIMREREFGE